MSSTCLLSLFFSLFFQTSSSLLCLFIILFCFFSLFMADRSRRGVHTTSSRRKGVTVPPKPIEPPAQEPPTSQETTATKEPPTTMEQDNTEQSLTQTQMQVLFCFSSLRCLLLQLLFLSTSLSRVRCVRVDFRALSSCSLELYPFTLFFQDCRNTDMLSFWSVSLIVF